MSTIEQPNAPESSEPTAVDLGNAIVQAWSWHTDALAQTPTHNAYKLVLDSETAGSPATLAIEPTVGADVESGLVFVERATKHHPPETFMLIRDPKGAVLTRVDKRGKQLKILPTADTDVSELTHAIATGTLHSPRKRSAQAISRLLFHSRH